MWQRFCCYSGRSVILGLVYYFFSFLHALLILCCPKRKTWMQNLAACEQVGSVLNEFFQTDLALYKHMHECVQYSDTCI